MACLRLGLTISIIFLSVLNISLTSHSRRGEFAVRNPATGEVITTIPRMGPCCVEKAASAASEAWSSWKNTTARERSKLLSRMAALMHENIDDLAKLVTLENGKPLAEARGEVLYAISFYEFYAEEAKRAYGDVIPSPVKDRLSITIRQPIGPAALITPWNFPCAMITRKVTSCLLATVQILRPPM